MTTKQYCSRLCRRLTGKTLRILIIRAGFPYHKDPYVYQWVWVFILLPFLEETSLNDLIDGDGKELRKLYGIVRKHPDSCECLVQLLSLPLFFDLLEAYQHANDTTKSRQRITLIFDDTNAEKYGKQMDVLHTLYDHCHDAYIMGYNSVLLLVVSGSFVFPVCCVLWLPKSHADDRSKNDIARDEMNALSAECEKPGQRLDEVELLCDSAYCRQKVMLPAIHAGLRVITKAGNTHTFEFEGELLTPKDIIERVKTRQWKYLDPDTWYHRVVAQHHTYGEVVLVARRRQLKNHKIMYDVVLCTKRFYTAVRIHTRYKARWNIELHFK